MQPVHPLADIKRGDGLASISAPEAAHWLQSPSPPEAKKRDWLDELEEDEDLDNPGFNMRGEPLEGVESDAVRTDGSNSAPALVVGPDEAQSRADDSV